MNLLPFVKPPATPGDPFDGWAVTPTEDPEKDYATGEDYARQALQAAKEMNDPAPVLYSLSWLYGKAHLQGKSQGAIEKGFLDQLVRLAMRASLN